MDNMVINIVLSDFVGEKPFIKHEYIGGKDRFYVFYKMEEGKSYGEIVKDKKIHEENFSNFLQECNETFPEKYKKITVENIKYILEHLDEIIDNPQYIYFDMPLDKAAKIIEEDPFYRNKKPVITVHDNIGTNKLEEIKRLFKENKSKLYIDLDTNYEHMPFSEYEKTVRKINEITEHIKSLNLSPLEETIYAFDYIRKRLYILEKENEPEALSRDINNILFNDPIVCVGYSNFLYLVLNKLGINCQIELLKSANPKNDMGHARNALYLKDDKYGIDGIFFLDATKNRRPREGDLNYLNLFYCFCKNKKFMESDDMETFISEYAPTKINELHDELEQLFTCDKEEIPKHMEALTTINFLKYLTGTNILIDRREIENGLDKEQKETLLEEADKVIKKCKKTIRAKEMLTAIYNVRKLEYYLNPEEYPLEEENFQNICPASAILFSLSKEEIKEYNSLSLNEKRIKMLEKFKEFAQEFSLGKKIEQVHATKTMQKVLQKKLAEEKAK